MPAPIVDKLYQAFKTAAESDEYRKMLETLKANGMASVAAREQRAMGAGILCIGAFLVGRAKLCGSHDSFRDATVFRTSEENT